MNLPALRKTYGTRTVLSVGEHICGAGRICAMIGANGSGKSTYLRILAGILRPDEGFLGKPDPPVTVGYMPQHSYAFDLSLKKNLLLNAERNSSKARNKAEQLIREMKLDSLSDRKASRFSGGETQKMALARLLMKDYGLLLLDEPTASMDMESALLSEQIIRSYVKRTGCAAILVTHSVAQAYRIADDLFFLEEGKAAESGACREILANPQSRELKKYLEFYGMAEGEDRNGRSLP